MWTRKKTVFTKHLEMVCEEKQKVTVLQTSMMINMLYLSSFDNHETEDERWAKTVPSKGINLPYSGNGSTHSQSAKTIYSLITPTPCRVWLYSLVMEGIEANIHIVIHGS